jgi:sugar/nucleoside kinase (ribokinase family)
VANIRAFVGFDGFVDEIVHVVDRRHDAMRYDRVPTLTRLGERVLAAAGKSTNIEGVVQQVKLGGNGPIMANALAVLGLTVTYVGAVGWPNLHPVFGELAQRAKIFGVAEPGHTDALEFEDGKLMLTKTASLNDVTWPVLQKRFGRDPLLAALAESDLVGFVNWTMIPFMSDLWEALLGEVCPHLPQAPRTLFIDLADPQKRTVADMRRALDLIQRFGPWFQVVLGLNEKEAWGIAGVLGVDTPTRDRAALARTAQAIAQCVKVHALVVHPVSYALAVTEGTLVEVEGPYEPNPKITTGAGDHFNAGFCLGRLLGLDLASALLAGVSTSGFYVRHARSPSVADLSALLRQGRS